MKFIIAIEPGTETTAFGVVVPDLPGCFSAGDTLDKAVGNARDAIELWCQAVIEDGGDFPVAKTLAEHQANPDFAGWIWAVVEMPSAKMKPGIQVANTEEFFKRGKGIAKLAYQGKRIPRERIIAFEDPEDLARHIPVQTTGKGDGEDE